MEVSSQLHAPAALPPQGKSPWYPLDRGWVGPRAVPDAVVKRKIPSPRRQSKPRNPIVQLVKLLLTTLKSGYCVTLRARARAHKHTQQEETKRVLKLYVYVNWSGKTRSSGKNSRRLLFLGYFSLYNEVSTNHKFVIT
jgi:hypothetical protein